MKHFRDLVLSTKEPALHNVLWIKPDKDDLTKYLVLMYEDGWKLLFGNGNSTRGINYRVIARRPDGYVVQLIDDSDPDNIKNLYPQGRAVDILLSNNVNVEVAINNINEQLRNISSVIRKAVFATDNTINSWQVSRAGKTFWVYDHISSLQSNGYFVGEPFLRKYTNNNSYTREALSLSDIVMAVDDEISSMRDTRMWYVNDITSLEAQLMNVADYKDIIQVESSLDSRYIQDVQIDGQSVVELENNVKVASISDNVRPVYMIDYANLETYYPGNAKVNKTFFFREGENNSGELTRYTSSITYENIELKEGDILYNLDQNNDFFIKSLYVIVKEGTYPGTARLITTDEYVSDLIYTYMQDFRETVVNQLDNYAEIDKAYNEGGTVTYRALKQGQEQMLVLKSMGAVIDELDSYDYNNDGVVNHQDIEILYSFVMQGTATINNVTYTQLQYEQAFPYKNLDVNQDGHITSADFTALYNILLNKNENDTNGEFVGSTTLFAIYDPTSKKIKIGYDYASYVDKDYSGDRSKLIILTLNPSPNVIYCDSITNRTYRWHTVDEDMIEVDKQKQVYYGRAVASGSTIEVTFTGIDAPSSVQDIDHIFVQCAYDINLEDIQYFHNWTLVLKGADGNPTYANITITRDMINSNVTTIYADAIILFKPLSQFTALIMLINNDQ